MAHGVRDASGTGPPGPAGATAPAPEGNEQPVRLGEADLVGKESPHPAAYGVRKVSGTGPPGPAGATAPARRKARKPSERSERPALEGNEQSLRARRLREMNRVPAARLTPPHRLPIKLALASLER